MCGSLVKKFVQFAGLPLPKMMALLCTMRDLELLFLPEFPAAKILAVSPDGLRLSNSPTSATPGVQAFDMGPLPNRLKTFRTHHESSCPNTSYRTRLDLTANFDPATHTITICRPLADMQLEAARVR
jgi:hypothetical protein